MASTYYEIYADETRIDGGGPFFFGALVASPRRVEILRNRVRTFRAASGCTAEMKWTKVSNAYLERYKQFADIVLRDPFVRFFVREVRCDDSWHAWERPSDERFWIAYYAFLRSHMSSYSRYDLVLDNKDGKRHRWTKLRFSMNATARRRFELKKTQVRSLLPRASHADDILQLVDVILGALTSEVTAKPKVELAEYVRATLDAQFDDPWIVDMTKVRPTARKRVFGAQNPATQRSTHAKTRNVQLPLRLDRMTGYPATDSED